MIVNRELEERLFIWVTMVVTSFCATPLAATARDAANGWEGSTPQDTQSSENEKRTSNTSNVSKEEKRDSGSQEAPPQSSGWNDDSRSRRADDAKRNNTEASATPTTRREGTAGVITTGDTALTAGQYADALRMLDDAWRATTPAQQDNKESALFFERKAIANRGLQRLTESERLIKQAIGHATTGGIKGTELYARLLFALADIQSQEGLPRESLASARQASAAVATATTGSPAIILIEAINTEARSLAEVGDLQGAEDKLNEALLKCDSLPKEASNLPPQSSVSKYSEYLKGKIKINQYYLAAIKGSAEKSRSLLDEGMSVIRGYAPGMPADTRYSPIILQAQRANYSQASLTAGLTDSDRLPGEDNLIRAALLQEQSIVKEKGKDLKVANESIKGAFDIRTKVLPANSIYVAETLLQTASLQLLKGRASDAAAQAQRASSSLERSVGRESLFFARASVELASVYISSNRVERLEPILIEAINILTKIRGADHPETLHATDLLCSTFVRNKKFANAIKYGEPALLNGEKQFGANSPKLSMTLTNLGAAYSHLKKFPESNNCLQRAQSLLARAGKTGSAEHADVLASIGVNNTMQKKWGAAEAAFKQARTIYTTVYGAKSPQALRMSELLRTMNALKNPRIPGINPLIENNFNPESPPFK
jgi:tetratricopeptide (TPR) repeat protein